MEEEKCGWLVTKAARGAEDLGGKIWNSNARNEKWRPPSKKILVVGTPSPKSSVGEDPFLSIGR